jgi:hypothetical protein
MSQQVRSFAVAMLVAITACGTARAAISFGDFEDSTTQGFAALTNSGIQPWTAPVAGAVITPGSGPMAGSKVLELTGTAGFNFGQSGGGALGYDFLAHNLRADFFANNTLEFDWEAVPNASPSGFSQLFNIILNSQSGGFVNVGGSNAGTPNTNQFYFNGYTGNKLHVVLDYTNYKNSILNSADPTGGGWLQFGIQPNAGGGAPGDMYFDNFALTPEPSSFMLVGVGVAGAMFRRRRQILA